MWYIRTWNIHSALTWRKSCLCDNTDEPGKHYAKWKKPGTEGKIPYESINVYKVSEEVIEAENGKTVSRF